MSQNHKKHTHTLSHLDKGERKQILKENGERLPRQSSMRNEHFMKINLNDSQCTINRVLKIKREEYQHSIRDSVYKLNTTISWAKEVRHQLQDIEKAQIKINSKNNANLRIVMDKEKIKLKNEANCKDLTCPKKPKEDAFLPENNLFNIRQQSIICFEDVFPMYRLGSSLVNYDHRVYIYGGYSFKGLSNSLNLHYYDQTMQSWRKISNHEGDLPYLCTCYHTAEQYRNYLIFIGGISIDSLRNRRYYNFQISLFDLEHEKWSKIRWNHCLRSHASTLYGNMLMIYGGINEKDEYLNTIFFITLNVSNVQQSTIMQFTTPNKPKAGIAFHKIVNTYDLEPSLKERVEVDGIISYGGKFSDGNVCSDVSVFRLNFKGRDGFNYGKPETEDCNGWEVLSLKGKKPEGRYDHSMNILNKKGICLIIGGMNEDNQILKDVWIMELCTFSWIQAEFDTSYDILTKGITGHSTTCDDSTIYIFGGVRNNNITNARFFSLNFAVSRSVAERERTNDETFNRTRLFKKFSQLPEDDFHV